MTTLDDDARTKWLEERKGGIGGSEAAALFGVHPWLSAFTLYHQKRKAIESESETPPMEWGRRLEPVVREAYSEKLGRVVRPGAVMQRHPSATWMLANTDGEIDPVPEHDGPGVYEGKVASFFKADEWDGDTPLAYQVQCTHYMVVLGHSWASLAVLLLGKYDPFHWRDVPLNEKFAAMLMEREHAFWHKNVLAGVEPDPDGSESTSRALKALYPKDNGLIVDLGAHVQRWAEDLTAARESIKAIEETEKDCRNRIVNAIGPASYGRFDDGSGFACRLESRAGHTVAPSSFRVLRSLKDVERKMAEHAKKAAKSEI